MSIVKSKVESRFRRSVESYEHNASIQKEIVVHLSNLLGKYCPDQSGDILEVGCGTGFLTERLCSQYSHATIWLNDLVDDMCRKAGDRCHIDISCRLVGDIESVELSGQYGLIVSASTFQWLEQPAITLKRLSDHLAEEGWLVFSTFGPDNFKELKTITGEGLQYYSMSEILSMLPDRLEVVYSQEEHSVLYFTEAVDVLKHIKKTGVNATSSHKMWTRRELDDFVAQYTTLFAEEGTYPLTYHPQYFICRKKSKRHS